MLITRCESSIAASLRTRSGIRDLELLEEPESLLIIIPILLGLPPSGKKVGFYGLDLYSLHASIEAVLEYLDKVDPVGANRARTRYGCFEHFGEDPRDYAYATGFGLTPSCVREVVNQLVELQRRAAEYARRDGRIAEDDFFYAEQNARLVKNAEEYYRTMFRGRVSSWNLRDHRL